MKELVRCRPCGYVMEKHKLGDVCPACGMPSKVFEPYRERVSLNRLKVLNLDLHPIAIHISQSFIALIPPLLLTILLFPGFFRMELIIVVNFFILLLPFALVLAFLTGIVDGITRFKSLKPPLLRNKLILSLLFIITSIALRLAPNPADHPLIPLLISLIGFSLAISLGLIGKKLLNVILPGTYPQKRGKKTSAPSATTTNPSKD